ncbi:MAG: histidine kinase [Cyclobacteriaceae bacterium]
MNIYLSTFRLIILLFATQSIYAQNKPEQIVKIDSLNDLLANSICADDNLAKGHYRAILSMLDVVDYSKGEMTAYKHYGSMMHCQGKLDSIIFYQKKSALIALENSSFSFAGRMFCNLGFLFNNSGNYDSSIYYFRQALHFGVKAKDTLLISISYTGTGINERELGNFDKSLEMYLKALSISETRNDTLGIITAKMNLLNFYRDHRPDLFLEDDILEVIKMSQNVGEIQHEVSAYEYLGYLKADSGAFDQAIMYINSGLELNKTLKDNNRQISLLGALSYAYRNYGDFKRSIKFSNEAIENATSSEFTEYLPSLYAENVESYVSLNEYQKAIIDGEKALSYGKKFESINLYYKTLQSMALAYNKIGMFDKAYQYQLEYSQLSEKLLSSEKNEQLIEMQTKYETEKKEAEIASLSQQASIQTLELKQKNQAMMIGSVAFLFLLIAIYFVYQQRETKKQQTQTELEQRFLRSQLNPHFISNALVAVQSFMLKNDSESAALYLTKFSKLMREILENSRKEFIPVEEEISMLRNYLDIHKLRLGAFNFSIEIDENIDPEVDTIPPMFVQPFVENAIEHGLNNLSEEGKIELKFQKDGDYISIEVNDNGSGLIKKKTNEDHVPLSSTIIKERMGLFNKSLKRKIKLVISEETKDTGEVKGTKVELKVPFSYI